MQQNYYNPQTELKYKEPEYLVRPTWKLAWGLLWRTWVLILPFYLILFLIMLIVKYTV